MDENEINEFIFYLNKYSKEHRKKLLKRMKQSFKSSVRIKTKKYMDENNIVFNKCISCGEDDYIEIHHLDYENPYLIAPLCMSCHRNQHSKNPKTIKFINLKEYKNYG